MFILDNTIFVCFFCNKVVYCLGPSLYPPKKPILSMRWPVRGYYQIALDQHSPVDTPSSAGGSCGLSSHFSLSPGLLKSAQGQNHVWVLENTDDCHQPRPTDIPSPDPGLTLCWGQMQANTARCSSCCSSHSPSHLTQPTASNTTCL